MPLLSALRLNMTNVPGAGNTERYRAALEMASYADANGVTAIGCEEHHLAATGWLPAPLLMAAAVAGCTTNIRISINALLIPLYDPVRLAEEIGYSINCPPGGSASSPESVTAHRNTTP